ncbi:peptidoglycan DD-metalloendopeptidase family protein [Tsuneonella sp. HG249]
MRRASLALAALVLTTAAGDPKKELEHVVSEGETLGGVANRSGVPASVIAEANGLREPYNLKKGEKLVIPRQRMHSVRKGETGSSISRRYGVPFAQIAIANGLDSAGTVRVGQKLIIPAVVKSPPTPSSAPADPYFRRPHDGEVLLNHRVRADGKGHAGIDVAAQPLDMVRASASGIVTSVDESDRRFGRTVTVDHGRGWTTFYGHLAKVTVGRGELVKSGERIGLAGDAGGAERAELHFEIRRDGRPIDPMSKLSP